jgi:hypothetical protein
MKLSAIEKDILLETINFYNLSNRGYNTKLDSCEYLTESGNRCAVGRCMIDEELNRSDLEGASVSFFIKDGDIDHIFKDEYKGCRYQFWDNLQILHDLRSNWTEDGLSESGKRKVERMFGVEIP